MPGSFSIGKIAGIDIDIHVSWIIILVLLMVSLATGWFPQLYPGWSVGTYWGVGLISALLLFVSVLLHELAHSLVARRRGLPVVQNGIPVGIVSRDAIMRYLEVRRSLGSGTPKGDGGKQLSEAA
jgi:Zn-dependent protease